MDTPLPPTLQSPDDLMEIPISDLVHTLNMRARNMVRWLKLCSKEIPEEATTYIVRSMMRDDARRHSAMVALRARAEETSRFAASLGVDCPVDLVRRAPILCACGLVRHVIGPDYDKWI